MVGIKPVLSSAVEPNGVCREPAGKLTTPPVPLTPRVQGPGGHGAPLQRLQQRRGGTLKAPLCNY